MHWSLRLAVRVPVMLPLWLVYRLGKMAEALGAWLDQRALPDGIRIDAEGKWR